MQSTEWTEGALNLYSEAELLCLSKILWSLNQDAERSTKKSQKRQIAWYDSSEGSII